MNATSLDLRSGQGILKASWNPMTETINNAVRKTFAPSYQDATVREP